MNDNWVVSRGNVMTDTGVLVAVVFDGQPAHTRPEDTKEVIRRANLLAAAPDLLDALECCLDVLTDRFDSDDLDMAFARARAAIEKAVPSGLLV